PQLQLRRTDGAGGCDTIPSTTQWVLGAAAGLDAPLANTSTGSLTLALSEGQTTDLFAADLSPTLFVAGKTFRITANFSDGTTATPNTTLVARTCVAFVTADRGTPGQTVSVKVAGSNFQPGAQVGFGADIAVSGVSVDSSSQIRDRKSVA